MGGFGLWSGWITRGELAALGWTLLHFCWQGTAIAVIYAFADRFFKRATSAARYAVALSALALMPLVALITFAGELQTAPPMHSSAADAAMQSDPPQMRFLPIAQTYLPAVASETHIRGGWLAAEASRLLPWIDGVWVFGVILLAVRAMGGWRQLERLRQAARCETPAHVLQSFQRIRARLKIGHRVVLRISDEVISPMAMGVFHATVILPVSAVLRLTPEELEAVLAHELGHIRRWDYATNLLQTALETVLFFHPAVWWLSRIVRYRREVCCDEIALEHCSNAIVYAQTLLRLEEQKAAEIPLAAALSGNSGSLLKRIEKVLGEDRPMENRMMGGVRVAVAGAIVIGLLFGPKMSDAVAASRPAVERVAKLLPKAVVVMPDDKIRPVNPDASSASSTPPHSTTPRPAPALKEIASVKVEARVRTSSMMLQAAEDKPASKGVSYIDGMRDAGYQLDLNNDLNTLISLKSVGVTPEYAKKMATLGFGKPTVQELISLKSLGVTPEYIAEMKQSGIGPKDFHEAVSEKALGITPEYATEMKKSGFGELGVQELISLKAQNVTPEYVTWLKRQFPDITLDELRRAAVFHLDDKFLAQAKSHGFDGKDLDKLLRLKMSGLLDE